MIRKAWNANSDLPPKLGLTCLSLSSESGAMETDAEPESRYHVQAVVRTKILFKSRPKPIIANVPKKI